MKKFEKLLQYSKRLEAFHLSRRHRELDDIQDFDTRKERLRTAALNRILPLDLAVAEHRMHNLDDQEHQGMQAEENKARQLIEQKKFVRQARDSLADTAGNEFDLIADIQGFTYHEELFQNLKQLPEASVDIFEHELTDSTEVELQQELEENRKALQGPPKRLEVQVEKIEPLAQNVAQQQVSEALEASKPEKQKQSSDRTAEKEDIEEQKPSDTVFFFRPQKKARK